MPNNDYWAYLRDENELKHYRTPGTPNKVHKYTDIDANGNYIYPETDTGTGNAVNRGSSPAKTGPNISGLVRGAERAKRKSLPNRVGYTGVRNDEPFASKVTGITSNTRMILDGRVTTPGIKRVLNDIQGEEDARKAGEYAERTNVLNRQKSRDEIRAEEAERNAKVRNQMNRQSVMDERRAQYDAKNAAKAQREASREAKSNLRNQDEKQGGDEKNLNGEFMRINKSNILSKDVGLRYDLSKRYKDFKKKNAPLTDEERDLNKYGVVGSKLRNAAKSAKNKADEIGSKIKSAVSGAAAKAKEGITGTAAEIKRGITGTVDKAKKLKKKYFGGN